MRQYDTLSHGEQNGGLFFQHGIKKMCYPYTDIFKGCLTHFNGEFVKHVQKNLQNYEYMFL